MRCVSNAQPLLFVGLLPTRPAFSAQPGRARAFGAQLAFRLPRLSAGPPNNALRPARAPPGGRARLHGASPNNKRRKTCPYTIFATYADAREEWAIEADSLDHAKQLVGDDANGDWLDTALHLETEAVERRDEFATGHDESPAVEEITPGHWAWRVAHRDYIEHSLKQNIAAISGDFHTHRLYGEFYDAFGKLIDGFVGQYELCIAMAETLTNWELANGLAEAYENAGVPWIEVVESFVETVLVATIESGELTDPAKILPAIPVLARTRTAA